jgi:hypothetical protein
VEIGKEYPTTELWDVERKEMKIKIIATTGIVTNRFFLPVRFCSLVGPDGNIMTVASRRNHEVTMVIGSSNMQRRAKFKL